MTSNRAPVNIAPTVTFDRRPIVNKMDTSAVAFETERSPQWQGRELEALLEGMQARYHILYGKFSASNTKTEKEKQWQEIVDE